MTDQAQSKGPLWAADGVVVDDEIVRFCAGDDAVLDNDLLPFDLQASRGHVLGLAKVGVLSSDEEKALDDALAKLLDEWHQGSFRVGPEDEDGHSAIERVLTERLGDVGKKVHTGRSRNDQVLVATRLWLKDTLDKLATLALDAASAALEKAAAHEDVVMPGYTHLQRAVPSTAGFFFAGHAESLCEDAEALRHARSLVDASPLGTAAGYGVNIALARQEVSDALGFSRVALNGLAAQNSRGRLEAHAVSAMLTFMGTVRHLAWDLSLFTTGEFAFVNLPARWCTGSSIMPNKRNPDVVELLRASFADVAGAHTALIASTALPSAYQRDLQVTKGPAMRAAETTMRVARLLPQLIADVDFDQAACARALEPAMFATDRAVELAVDGVPFRDAYRQIKEELKTAEAGGDLDAMGKKSVAERTSLGAPGNLGLDLLQARVEALRA